MRRNYIGGERVTPGGLANYPCEKSEIGKVADIHDLFDAPERWTAMAVHTDYELGIGQITWMDRSGRCVIIRLNVAEGGYYTTCDRCCTQMLSDGDENFEHAFDAITAFLQCGWRVGEDDSIVCIECLRACALEMNIGFASGKNRVNGGEA